MGAVKQTTTKSPGKGSVGKASGPTGGKSTGKASGPSGGKSTGKASGPSGGKSTGKASEKTSGTPSGKTNGKSSGKTNGKTAKNAEEGGKEAEHMSNLPLSIFNVCNSMLGAGVIVMPFALMEAGFGLGIILLVVSAGLTDYSLCLLIHAGALAKKYTYADTTKVAFGRCGQVIVLLWAFFYPMVVMTGYNMIMGDTFSKLLIRLTGQEDIDELRSHWWGRRELIILFLVLTTQLPLSLYRNIAGLAKWAAISLVSLVIIIVVMLVRLVELDIPNSPGSYDFAKLDALQALGIISAAYFCHHSSFIMYRSMKRPTEKRWDEVVHISLVVSLSAVLAVGIIGYATFTENVEGDILENYCSDDDLANVARFMFLVTIIISFPVELFVARKIIEDVFFREENKIIPLWRHVLITIVIISANYGFSLITECLGILVEIAGLVFSVPLAYMFPPLLVMKLEPHPIFHHKNIGRFFLFLIGLGVFIGGWYETIRELHHDEIGCSEGREPAHCLAVNATNSTI